MSPRRADEGLDGPFRFWKMEANGDECLIVDARGRRNPVTPALARRLADRRQGPGFHQIGVVLDCDDAAARLLFLNPDGSTLGACGTATRAAAHLLMEATGETALRLRTERGLLACARTPGGAIQVDMGAPLLGWAEIPLAEPMDTLSLPIDGSPVATGMGNPHCTFMVEDVEQVDLPVLGPRIERHPLFPERTNVHVAQVIDPGTLRVRIWERFGGVIAASGSCACAAAVAGIRRGLLDRRVTVRCDGGSVTVAWAPGGGVLLTGGITPLLSGTLDAWLTSAGPPPAPAGGEA